MKASESRSDRVNWRINDFCRAHGIGRSLFYHEVQRGEINVIKVGKRTLVPDTEAKAWDGAQSARNMTTMLEAARAYAKRGLPVFPVKPLEKTPLFKGSFHDATTDLAKITEVWTANPDANIGMEPGAVHQMVLDYDPGHDLAVVEQNVGPLPDTQRRNPGHLVGDSTTGSPPTTARSSQRQRPKIAPHVDVRSHRSYVLLPPSKTKDGDYKWERDGKPAYRTDEMVRVANSAMEKHEDRDNWLIEPDIKANGVVRQKRAGLRRWRGA